ncbi:MAG TPA: GTP-binding protein, partial [Chthoniobacterales bacterium]|nr:GTP-binding protein [Chthoniobacterales bacterium]
IRQSLIDLLAHIEASVDFSEEGISPDNDEQLRRRIESISAEIRALLATADYGRLLRDGVRIVIYGATNAGKSSLLNRLLGYERVIVSETHGTTRDTIEEAMNLQGIPVRLLDTAGLRASTSQVEREGIARTERSLQTADLRLHVLDRNAPPPSHFGQAGTNGNDLLVLNKSDLSEHAAWKNTDAIRLSCLTGEGMDKLEKAILSRIGKQNLRPENSFAINMRHRDCLRRALEACARATTALDQKVSAEYVSVDLNEALAAVGEVIGRTGVEQILDSVFGQFCIGK